MYWKQKNPQNKRICRSPQRISEQFSRWMSTQLVKWGARERKASIINSSAVACFFHLKFHHKIRVLYILNWVLTSIKASTKIGMIKKKIGQQQDCSIKIKGVFFDRTVSIFLHLICVFLLFHLDGMFSISSTALSLRHMASLTTLFHWCSGK